MHEQLGRISGDSINTNGMSALRTVRPSDVKFAKPAPDEPSATDIAVADIHQHLDRVYTVVGRLEVIADKFFGAGPKEASGSLGNAPADNKYEALRAAVSRLSHLADQLETETDRVQRI